METILVVESQAITRRCWADALLNRGYGILEAETPSEALDLVRSHVGVISALLVEDLFSDKTAMKLVREMKEANPNLCVITSCAFCSDDLPNFLRYDAALEKPASPQKVISIIEQLLAQGKNWISN